jgi:hypothetical protein
LDAARRAAAIVEERLAAWEPVPTDSAIVRELDRIVASGLERQGQLPVVPEATR